jgi:YHS domain-containing protein
VKFFNSLLLLVLACFLLIIVGCGQKQEEPAEQPETTEPVVEEVKAVAADYVPSAEQIGTETTCGACGMTMQVTAETPALVYQDEIYYFCTAEEKAEFAAAPEKFMMEMEAEPEEESTEESPEEGH